MAKRVEITLVDDLDGRAADETVRFALDGSTYEIDLSDENAVALRSAVAPYVDVARKAPAGARPRRRRQ